MKTVQLYDRHWSRMGNKQLHECCECGLVHTVKHKVVDGVLWEMWTVHKAETRKARAARPRNPKVRHGRGKETRKGR